MNSNDETAVGSKVIINVRDGDVVVKGRSEGDVRVVGKAQTTSQDGNTIINARDSVVVEVPHNHRIEINGEGVQDVALKRVGDVRLATLQGSLAANEVNSLTAEDIHGNASVRGVNGDVRLGDVHGDLDIKGARAVTVGTLHGDTQFRDMESLRFEEAHGHLKVKATRTVSGDRVEGHALLKDVEQVTLNQVSGHLNVKMGRDVSVESVSGHAELKEVSGSVRIESVDGNLELKGIGTSLAVEEVQGDVIIRGAWQPGGEYSFSAQGDVELVTEGSVHFILKTEGQLDTGEGCEVQEDPDGTTHVYFGERENAAIVTFEAEGDVLINIREHEHGRYSHRAPRPPRPPRAHRSQGDWNREWEFNWEKTGPEVEQEVRRAMDEVRTEMHRAKHTVRHELEKAMRDIDANARGPVGGVIRNAMHDLMNSLRDKPGGARSEESVRETPVNEPSEEVKMILQMIADGKITPDQGEQLLQAMGEK